ncbi:MAG TPA: TonB-dependent receptor [Draconibacterium sp.]|nr:TonB-dependent receptor [Draconibacterium sp.]
MKKTILSTVLVAVLGLFSLATSAQGTIKGKIVDAETNEALIGANVVLEGTTIGTVTNVDGNFSLSVKAGNQKINISYIGYIAQQLSVSVSNGRTNDLGEIKLESESIGINEVKVLASFARDRQTPVSMSTIEPMQIEEKLGTQEFPEILKTTPSIYATKDNGGFGDGRVNLRGFGSENLGILTNGIPINGMENGKVYWSDWAGLSDVTSTMQVQRGLGASKLGLSSVGGTINIITKSTDVKKGGSFYSGFGDSGYRKLAFSVSTGLTEKGWAITLLGAHTYGNGYIDGLTFDDYSYFANISKRISDNQTVTFTVFGSPQTHNQRGNRHTIEYYRNKKDGPRSNDDYGIRKGKPYGGGYGYNYYNKPQASLNHYWNINSKTLWTNVLYASIGKGGGRRVGGNESNWLTIDYNTGLDKPEIKRTAEGLLDFNAVAQANKASLDGSQCFIGNSVNGHHWAGLLSTLTTEWKSINWTAGFDGRYYKGSHYNEVDDLLGGAFYLNSDDINKPANTKLFSGDKYGYNETGVIWWEGLFLQGEYTSDKFSGFASAAASNTSYRWYNFFEYTPGNQESDLVSFLPWNVKAGLNYNIDSHQNVYVNAGYIKRAPILSNTFLNYTTEVNKKVKYETVITTEVGYGFKTKNMSFKIDAYRTNWLDKALVRSLGQGGFANISGINALHKGIEAELTYKPAPKLTLYGMLSLGDWIWQNNVEADQYDQNNNYRGTFYAYVKNVHVGNAAQTTAALTINYEILPKLRIGADYTYFGKNYADFNVNTRTSPSDQVEAWKMPDFGLIDCNMNYKFKIGTADATLYGKVNNLFNTEYVSDATDGTDHDQYTSLVYYGFGTTWSTGLKIMF